MQIGACINFWKLKEKNIDRFPDEESRASRFTRRQISNFRSQSGAIRPKFFCFSVYGPFNSDGDEASFPTEKWTAQTAEKFTTQRRLATHLMLSAGR
jgi:hypothetical protein